MSSSNPASNRRSVANVPPSLEESGRDNNSQSDENNDALIQELESSRRVRARLATSADGSLPRVLSLLLPRLLRKMDANRDGIIRNSRIGSSSTTQELRTRIHEEYLGVINHAIDRIEILRNIDMLHIVQSMTEFVAEMANASCFMTLGLTLAFKILKLCMNRSNERICLGNNIDNLVSVLRASIVTLERMDRASSRNQTTDSNQSVSNVAGWLVLDSISLMMGIRPLGLDPLPSGGDRDVQIDDQEYSLRYTKTITAIAPLAGSATYDLFLDLILFQPNGTSCGLSPRGVGRMQSLNSSRASQAEVIDSVPIPQSRWNELKLALLKVATGTVKGGGVFGWRGEMKEEMNEHASEDCIGTARAIVLLVLAVSGRGRSKDENALKVVNFAKASLQAYNIGEASAPMQKRAKGGRSQSPRSVPMEDDSTMVRAVTMLLFLALGTVEACSAIRKHDEQWSSNTSISSSTIAPLRSDAVNDSRSPLSSKTAHAVLSFVVEQLQINKASIRSSQRLNEDEAKLISLCLHAAELTLRLNEADDAMRRTKRMRIGWGDDTVCVSRLLLVIGKWLNSYIAKESLLTSNLEFELESGFTKDTFKQIHKIAFEILKSDVLPLLSRDITQGLDVEEYDDQAVHAPEVAYRHRGRIARERRVARSRQNTLVPPMEIRKCCVDILRTMAIYSIERDSFLDVPVLLFKCLMVDRELSSHITVVLEEMLELYEPYVVKLRSEIDGACFMEDRLVQAATPLLPLLLTASTSASISQRLVIQWCDRVLKVLDKNAARILCTRLATDSDQFVSTQAKQLILSIKADETSKIDVSSGVMFFDSDNELDMEIVRRKLNNEIEALAKTLQITRDGAAAMLQSNHYSFDQALEAIKASEDLESTLKSCGVRHRCRSLICGDSVYEDANVEVNQCKICYDDIPSQDDAYSLPCKHLFCRDCFSSYLRVKIECRELMNCPHHGCNEYVVEADVKNLLPPILQVEWNNFHFRQFVMQNCHYKFCPGNDCTMVAFSENIKPVVDAHCTKCDTSFCFCCGEEPHTPASCHDAEEFLPLLNTSEYTVSKFSKRCPNCSVPIEKNQGCNHMTCRECNSHFCWLCLSLINGYEDLERHACNKFDPRDMFNAKERDEFFLSRYEASAEGEVFAKKELDSFLKRMADAECVADDDIVKVFECLITSRNFLKNSFIIAWAWQKEEAKDESSSVRKEIFEAQQATLTAFTENLQQLVERKEDFIDIDALKFYSRVLELYIERMMDFLARCKTMKKSQE